MIPKTRVQHNYNWKCWILCQTFCATLLWDTCMRQPNGINTGERNVRAHFCSWTKVPRKSSLWSWNLLGLPGDNLLCILGNSPTCIKWQGSLVFICSKSWRYLQTSIGVFSLHLPAAYRSLFKPSLYVVLEGRSQTFTNDLTLWICKLKSLLVFGRSSVSCRSTSEGACIESEGLGTNNCKYLERNWHEHARSQNIRYEETLVT